MALPDRDSFLSETRIGIFTTLGSNGAPIAVPVWYDWDGQRARIFSSRSSAKIRRLEHDPRAWLLVTNRVGEPEFWVSLEGTVEMRSEGALALAELLAARYWDLSNEKNAESLGRWRDGAATLLLLELTPSRIRTYGK